MLDEVASLVEAMDNNPLSDSQESPGGQMMEHEEWQPETAGRLKQSDGHNSSDGEQPLSQEPDDFGDMSDVQLNESYSSEEEPMSKEGIPSPSPSPAPRKMAKGTSRSKKVTAAKRYT